MKPPSSAGVYRDGRVYSLSQKDPHPPLRGTFSRHREKALTTLEPLGVVRALSRVSGRGWPEAG
jgi:hypothetical protein